MRRQKLRFRTSLLALQPCGNGILSQHLRVPTGQSRLSLSRLSPVLGKSCSRSVFKIPGCVHSDCKSSLESHVRYATQDSRICKHRLRSVFRGVGNAKDHRLQTTIQRLGDLAHIHTVEPGMLRAFRKYAISEKDAFIRDATAWELLSTAQHHGLPTRLLDWSHNPLIAAHFVTNTPEDLDRDGAIWIVDAGELNARCEEFRKWNLARPVGARVIGVFSIDQLEDYCRDNAPTLMLPHSRISSLEAFDATQLRCAFLEPPSIDVRLIHQQGLFSVLSPDVDMDLLLTTHPECARKVIVPAWLKREVRDKLDAVGISERTLTGGLDGLCSWLRRYYSQGARVTRAAAPKTPESGTAATVFVDNEESRRSSVCWGDGL